VNNSLVALLGENLIFICLATLFLFVAGWAWKDLKPYDLPQPLPDWFQYWFGSIQILGGLLPFLALIWWGFWRAYPSAIAVLVPYLVVLNIQIISEILALRHFRSVVWVMVPYLYIPYRLWQLYESLYVLEPHPELIWVRYLLILNLGIWLLNYLLDLAQLPRLFRWEESETRL
jgi:hypothetical protein